MKKVEVFGSFGGGMVTQAHPEKLLDSQSVLMENADVLAGGVVQNRGAYSQTNSNGGSITGNTQGRFKYQNLAGGTDIVAINGKLYSVSGATYTQIPITGLTQFQQSRIIEAVQLRDKMYFATGSGIVVYDGVTAALMTAYAPTGLEALYIGTNGYAANPDSYLSDAVGAANVILGVAPSVRYGLINTNVTFTTYVEKVSTDTLEYLFEYKNVDSLDYKAINGSTWQSAKTITCKFSAKNDYMIRVTIRKVSTTVELSQYILPKFKVNSTPEEKPEPNVTFANLSTCNRIFVHYDRLFIYGDTTNLDFLYISHLNRFDFFPRTNVIKVADPLRGALQSVVRFKDFLVCFTNGSLQMITGVSPKDFTLSPIHTTLGTKFAYSVQVMKNYLAFVGNDNGAYILKTFNFASNNKMNVERIDDNIKDVLTAQIKTASRVLSCIYNDQYYLYIENGSNKFIYRFYYDLGIWVRDTLPFSIVTMDNVDNVVTMTAPTTGTIYKLLQNVYYDGTATPFSVHLISKDFDFDMPHHRKKMKEYQVLMKLTSATSAVVKVYGDNTQLISKAITADAAQNSDAQKLKVQTSGRFRYAKTDILYTVTENTQLIGFGFIFKENTPK